MHQTKIGRLIRVYDPTDAYKVNSFDTYKLEPGDYPISGEILLNGNLTYLLMIDIRKSTAEVQNWVIFYVSLSDENVELLPISAPLGYLN